MIPLEADFLGAGDDADIFAAMTGDARFSRAPNLPGRCPETGARPAGALPKPRRTARGAARRHGGGDRRD